MRYRLVVLVLIAGLLASCLPQSQLRAVPEPVVRLPGHVLPALGVKRVQVKTLQEWSSELCRGLFPHLPRADMTPFRVLLIVGAVIVGGLAAFGLFPVALVAAAALVPLVVVLYLLDVDLYEDEPVLVVASTMLWGARGFGVAPRGDSGNGVRIARSPGGGSND
jgi:hypothetical protein